jgi:ferrous iron transport protein A
MKAAMDITQLEVGRTARVVEIQGGQALQQKLRAIGIVPGRTIGKTNRAILKGPLVLTVGAVQIAIGFGMARKIVIEPLDAAIL